MKTLGFTIASLHEGSNGKRWRLCLDNISHFTVQPNLREPYPYIRFMLKSEETDAKAKQIGYEQVSEENISPR